ncbi:MULTISPECIES: hypothetical protein [unclassified Myroides]|uniref:hypothetical protein n=1 Tax=unclassified Myroides TaxID=2642485 RepID=UPI0015F8D527|nr:MULTISPECIES: hypothetical protein [unclassified Myroides]MBB1148812.1 hypothetical protein [Myroides sp. NP-2]MDM1406522.1 hypothetical protein [Myroides sp. DF42-4-2]
MIKRIILSFSLILSAQAFAQQGTASPYSFYGIGDLGYNGTNEYKAMGGNSVYSDSLHLNLLNPAAISQLKATTFSVGSTSKFYNFKSDQSSDNIKRQSLDYFALGLPLSKKYSVIFGLQPYSNVGYKIESVKTNELNQITNNQLEGEGGINRVFLGAGYEINKNFQVGVQASYFFGNTKHMNLITMIDAGDGFALTYRTNEMRRIDYKGYEIRGAVQYKGKLKGYDFQANVTYSPETKLTADNLTNLRILNANGGIVDAREIFNGSTNLKKPQEFSLGAGIGENLKWFVSGQFTYVENSKLANSWNQSSYSGFKDTKRYAIGGFYIPKYNSFTSYFDRVVYRAGFRYENTGLELKNQSIDDYAVSVGAGFPLFGRTLSNVNIGLEYGNRGTKSSGLIKENYFNLSIGLSLNDFWFMKRKFD